MRRAWIAMALVAAITGCGDDGEELEIEVGEDTVRMEVPEDASERLERTGRRVGGRVGEALEETGQAIEEAGRRIREEAADSLDE
ncbi:MAG: hypothetical protein R3326_01635 [Gemmatimonadota bacterium]|nr:hypothetical protein [Gemmatimonadota bacterium]